MCDRIPASAWIASADIPLYDEYRWPGLAGLAVTQAAPRFRFEQDCATPPVPGDERGYAVAGRAGVSQPDGQWQLQVQVAHWRGETWRGGETVLAVLSAATTALRSCQLTAPQSSPSLTTEEPQRLAAVLSLGDGRVLHQYLLADPDNSTVVELAMWATAPRLPWPSVPDSQVLDAMAAPLCTAYVGSCR